MRRPATLLFFFGFILVKTSFCQSSELLVQGETGKLYLLHLVTPKENWYSIGRLYNVSPKEVAPFNNLTIDKPLSIGQTLQIPLKATNFTQSLQKASPGETLVPVYHIVQEKEWMYRISVNHNKVPVENLEKWNNINKDLVKIGMHLIVGFLKVKTALSALATAVKSESNPGGIAGNPLSSPPRTPDSPARMKPVENKVTVALQDTAAIKKQTVKTNPAEKKSLPGAGVGIGTIQFNGGYFKADYTEENLSASGLAGTFKSTSGWQDGKYYALMNNVAVGTIIKVTVPSDNKTIYAKVLGQLPDMKESAGLTIRISNAAASELGQSEGKFNVDIRY